jgi:hypothetical protein
MSIGTTLGGMLAVSIRQLRKSTGPIRELPDSLVHICASRWTDDVKGRFGLGDLGTSGDMGRARKSHGGGVLTLCSYCS